MHFQDKSSGFELELPDGWRRLFIFEQVKSNPFKGMLPRTLTEGPILVNPGGNAMVIAVQQMEGADTDNYQPVAEKIAAEAGLSISKVDSYQLGDKTHTTVVWKRDSDGNQEIKTYFIVFGRLLWNISVLINGSETSYEEIIDTFNVLPLVRKMME